MKTTLPCKNCHKQVEPDSARIFAEVFICQDCHTQAVHFHQRLEREVNGLLLMARDSIRVALLQGTFSFPEGPQAEVDKRRVLEEILRMEDAREHQQKVNTCQTGSESRGQVTQSGDNMPPHVRTLAALGAASSPKPSLPK